ncbi:MAG: hypothetical protein KIT84_03865 [Labilithrix sp.]|nr:hypothetical protein [Labilithrix sp.]MCW5810121.1 hypothetical protein [Labilithrix sp.]
MSFDLVVFRATKAIDDAAAPPPLEASERPAAFYAALTEQFPELDDDEDESPFAAAIEHTDRHVVMNVSFSRAGEVAHAVAVLAKKHDLDVYDPQAKTLRRAKDPLPKAPPKKPKPKDAVALFTEELAPKLAAHGFAPVGPNRWGRMSKGGVHQEVGLNLATRAVRVDVGFAHTDALAAVRRALGEPKLPVPMMGLEYLHFRGWIPGEPWSEATSTGAAFADETERYALPFFDSVATLETAAYFFSATKPPSEARKSSSSPPPSRSRAQRRRRTRS